MWATDVCSRASYAARGPAAFRGSWLARLIEVAPDRVVHAADEVELENVTHFCLGSIWGEGEAGLAHVDLDGGGTCGRHEGEKQLGEHV